MNHQTTRDNIIEAADQLFYRQGFEHTSFADVAKAVGISRGNFYYHFKSKDDILDAVIELRLTKTQQLLDTWEQTNELPADRVRSFFKMLIVNQDPIMRYGCPVGTLCAELAKLNHSAQVEANQLFTLFRDWLARQFIVLGYKKEAEAIAMHLLVRSQGIATLANAFHDANFIQREVKDMNNWLNARLQVTP